MLRQRRLGVLILVAVLVTAGALAVAILLVVRGGTIERQLARAYERQLPGSLSLSSVRLAAIDRWQINDVSLDWAGDAARVRCRQVELHGDWRQAEVDALVVQQPVIEIADSGIVAVRDFLHALQDLLAGIEHEPTAESQSENNLSIFVQEAQLKVNGQLLATVDAGYRVTNQAKDERSFAHGDTWFVAIEWADESQPLQFAGKFGLPDTAVAWSEASGALPLTSIWQQVHGLVGEIAEIDRSVLAAVQPWLPAEIVVEWLNPFELQLATRGSWLDSVVESLVLGHIGGASPHAFVHWRQPTTENQLPDQSSALPLQLRWQGEVVSIPQGQVPVAQFDDALQATPLARLSSQLRRWLPNVIELSGSRLLLEDRVAQLALSFSLLESEKLQNEATEEERLAMQQRPAADIILVVHHDPRQRAIFDLRQVQVRQGAMAAAPHRTIAGDVEHLLRGSGVIRLQETSTTSQPMVDVQIDSWAMPIAYELWNDGLRLGDLASAMSQVQLAVTHDGSLTLIARGAGPDETAPFYRWTPTDNPWQMEVANVPLALVTSLDEDLTLSAGIARKGVVKGSWVTRQSGRLGVGEIDVAVHGEQGSVDFDGWGVRDFTGQVSLAFRGRPLRLLSIQAQGQVPDSSFTMTREHQSGSPWQLDLRSNDLTSLAQQAVLPLTLPPLTGTTLDLSGPLLTPKGGAGASGSDWRVTANDLAWLPYFDGVRAQAQFSWADGKQPGVTLVTTSGKLTSGRCDLAAFLPLPEQTEIAAGAVGANDAVGGDSLTTLSVKDPVAFDVRLPLVLGDAYEIGSSTDPAHVVARIAANTAVSADGIVAQPITASARGYLSQDEAAQVHSEVTAVVDPLFGSWFLNVVQPWLGPVAGDLGLSGSAPVALVLRVMRGQLQPIEVSTAALRHTMQIGPLGLFGVSGPLQISVSPAAQENRIADDAEKQTDSDAATYSE